MDNQAQPNVPPFQPQPQTQTPTTSPTNWSKTLFFIIFGLIVVAGSVFAGIQIGKNQITKQQPITEQPTISPTQTVVNSIRIPTITIPMEPNSTIDPTEGWKMFESSDNKLTFKYPKDWYTQPLVFQGNVTFGVISLLINNHQYDTGEPSSLNIHYWNNPNKLTLEQFQSQIDSEGGRGYSLFKPSEQSATKVKIGGIDGYYFSKSDCEPFACAGYVVNTGDRIYEIKIFPSSIKYKDLVDQILSTFKFIN